MRMRVTCCAVARLTSVALVCMAARLLFAGETSGAPDRAESRFRLGPFFEYRATSGGGSFWALRPFFASDADPVSDTRVTDLAWPLGTYHRDREEAWWRLGIAYGSDNDVRREDAAWKAAVFPFYFQGRSRQGEDYWALFPIYGRLPHVLLMDDIDFVLFPLYLNYEVNRVEREYWLWPMFSRTGADPDINRVGVFPLFGRTRRGENSHLYLFWPFWTSAEYREARNPGSFWMLFPVAGRVERDKERQWMFVPPFFSYAKTDTAERWRLPWPFYESETGKGYAKRSIWPLYGSLSREDEQRRYALWPFFETFSLRGKSRRTERTRLFPLYVSETVYAAGSDGVERAVEGYTRVWPFYAREWKGDASTLRAPSLSLIRQSSAIERNWAPFWTLYERDERDGIVAHDALWGLFRYRYVVEAPAEEGGR